MTADTWAVQIQLSVCGDLLYAHATLTEGLVPLTGVARVPLHDEEPSVSERAQAARRALTELAGALRRFEVPAAERRRAAPYEPDAEPALATTEHSALGA